MKIGLSHPRGRVHLVFAMWSLLAIAVLLCPPVSAGGSAERTSLPIWGESVSLTGRAEDAGGAEGLLRDFASLLPAGSEGLDDPDKISDAVGVEQLFSLAVGVLAGKGSEIGSFLLLLVGCVILLALSGTLDGERGVLCRVGIGTVCSVSVFLRLLPLVRGVCDALDSLGGFFSSLIPLVASVNAMGGSASVAQTQAVGMTLTMHLYGEIGRWLTAVALACFAFGMIGALGGTLSNIGRALRGLFGRGMGLLTALVAGTLSLQTLLSGVSDSATMRIARFAITGSVPIVGGTVGAALSTLAGGLSYARGVIGGGGVAVLIITAASPLVIMLLYKLCFFAAISLGELTGADTGSLSAAAGSLDAALSAYVMTAVIYIFELVLFIMGSSSIQ